MTVTLGVGNPFQFILDACSSEPTERRCVVWWDGRKFGRHFPRRNADGSPVVPHNVCNRVFLSCYPATICYECAEQIETIERQDEANALALARAAASARARQQTGGGRYGGGQ